MIYILMTNDVTCAQVKIATLILASKFVIFCREYFKVLLHSVSKPSVVEAEDSEQKFVLWSRFCVRHFNNITHEHT